MFLCLKILTSSEIETFMNFQKSVGVVWLPPPSGFTPLDIICHIAKLALLLERPCFTFNFSHSGISHQIHRLRRGTIKSRFLVSLCVRRAACVESSKFFTRDRKHTKFLNTWEKQEPWPEFTWHKSTWVSLFMAYLHPANFNWSHNEQIHANSASTMIKVRL